MVRMVKCCYCKIQDTKDNVFQLPNKRYAHQKCYDGVQRDKKELDELVEEIKRIHNIDIIPPRFYPFLQDLRNGTNRCQGSSIKKKKQGYRYLIIKKTYQLYEKEIRKHISYNRIEDVNNMLMYSYAIITNKIDKVRKRLYDEYKANKSQSQKVEVTENQERIVIDTPTNQKKKYSWLEEDN